MRSASSDQSDRSGLPGFLPDIAASLHDPGLSVARNAFASSSHYQRHRAKEPTISYQAAKALQPI
ncbi:MAG: hypothetical protein CMJ74_12510 [Planctomycetaceae bacterium]|nr:hypothetical protein [Planctomycetaceae bacterium]